jgi:hypothetical protein
MPAFSVISSHRVALHARSRQLGGAIVADFSRNQAITFCHREYYGGAVRRISTDRGAFAAERDCAPIAEIHSGLGSDQGQQLDFGSHRHSAPAPGLDVAKAHHIVGCMPLFDADSSD